MKNSTTTLLRPRITEKATVQNEKNAYVFEIDAKANKTDVANAILKTTKCIQYL